MYFWSNSDEISFFSQVQIFHLMASEWSFLILTEHRFVTEVKNSHEVRTVQRWNSPFTVFMAANPPNLARVSILSV